ncbi:cell division protein FtsQ/DivIB [Corynebacterium yonathiae]|uniref:FtsQ-type POTRA domain-containing protein n=1 Tax=Corynebacterium yonathiae TaxID=2913504 RepID=A0A9X3RKT2_9CORY|nr:FtsQ-type POTRA domain-containing protein [Corynebacterium sp. BWA136]MCZ9295655.1 FtsQ-type POTRA domain-containing protein [Corynebacterium yonathiae]MDK2582199.1 FtsQ-type POTRA domain-containing protein [Corynebacterium sp. BWA136]
MRVSSKFIAGVIAAVVAVAVIITAVVWTVPILKVRNFQVEGLHQLDPAQVEEASGVPEGENLLRVNTREAAAGVAGLDWVDSVTVSRDFPSTLTFNVSEHKAVAFVKRDNKPFLIDDKGEEFTSAEPPAGAVEVTGSVDSGSPQTQDAVRAIAVLSEDVRNQVAKLEVADEYSLTFTTKDGRRVFWGAGDSNNEDKAHAFETVLKMEGREWNISNPELVTTRG